MEEVCEGKDFSFPSQEEHILSYWSQIDAFKGQLARTQNLSEYIFYDGPPFATGLPHYGHILAGTIKDIVTRFQSMTGHHVTRRFGWDCHGLPVENEIDRKLGIKRRDQILEMGIDKYNEECRSIVTRYVEEWETIITRTGRWIDFKNDYKTMDLKFMESVWWVFAQLYQKGLIYKGFKVWLQLIPFSVAFASFTISLLKSSLSCRSCLTVLGARPRYLILKLVRTTRYLLGFSVTLVILLKFL